MVFELKMFVVPFLHNYDSKTRKKCLNAFLVCNYNACSYNFTMKCILHSTYCIEIVNKIIDKRN